jgi:hypothetical protein
MNNDALIIALAEFATLVEAQATQAGHSETRTELLTAALQAVNKTLSASGDESKAAAKVIADAIKSIQFKSSDVKVEPQINVSSGPIDLTVTAGETHNHITMPAPEVTIAESTWKTLKVDFSYRNGSIVGATVKREN